MSGHMGINIPTVSNLESGALELILSLPLSPAILPKPVYKIRLNQMTVIFSNKIEKRVTEETKLVTYYLIYPCSESTKATFQVTTYFVSIYAYSLLKEPPSCFG